MHTKARTALHSSKVEDQAILFRVYRFVNTSDDPKKQRENLDIVGSLSDELSKLYIQANESALVLQAAFGRIHNAQTRLHQMEGFSGKSGPRLRSDIYSAHNRHMDDLHGRKNEAIKIFKRAERNFWDQFKKEFPKISQKNVVLLVDKSIGLSTGKN